MLERLRSIVLNDDTKAGRNFDLFIQGMIVLSLVTFSMDTIPNKSADYYQTLYIVEVATVSIFSVEYILRVILTKGKLRFIFSFYGLVDLLAIMPFYLSGGLDLRSLRALRLLRLFKLLRYSYAIRKLRNAVMLARQELVLFFSLTCVLLYLSAVGIYYFENEAQPEKFSSIIDSLWWAVATLTTVGYGDVYPITAGGKLFTFLILMIGLGIVAIPAGIIASSISAASRELEE